MLDFKLEARPALNGASLNYAGISIRELTNIKLLSVAANAAQRNDASDALNAHCGVSWPSVGSSTSNNNVQCLGLQLEQAFLMSEHNDAEHLSLANELAKTSAVTDQTDSWVSIEVSGENKLALLERICPINLIDAQFSDGAVARTMMEHLNVIITRRGDAFVLLCARSYADSLLHALSTSADFVS